MKKVIEFLKDEVWYAGVVNDGYCFPLTSQDNYKINLNYNDTYNQINPLFLSSKGVPSATILPPSIITT